MDNDFQPVVSHRFSFRSKPVPNWNGVIESEVLVVEPNKKLSYSWGTMGLESVVVWTLVATANGTLVRMEHSGFPVDHDAAYKGASYGWQNFHRQPGALARGVAITSATKGDLIMQARMSQTAHDFPLDSHYR